MERPQLRTDPKQEVGNRLRLLRLALGYDNASKFAREVFGWAPQRLRNYEVGNNAIQDDVLRQIEEKTDATVEWLLRGVRKRMPYDLMVKIEAAEKSEMHTLSDGVKRARVGRPKLLKTASQK